MKKYLFLTIAVALASSVSAQSFKIIKTDGTADTYSNSDIERIEFTTEAEVPAPVVGDYYFADGTWGADEQAGTPIGRVFYVGLGEGDSEDNYQVSGFVGGTFHGYVVALQDASTMAQWDVLPSIMQDYNGTSKSTTDFAGYTNTQTLKGKASDLAFSFPAAGAAVNYETKVAAPQSSSGWFLPSAGQMKAVVSYNDSLLSEKDYWTSSESLDTNAYYLSYNWLSGHQCTDSGKSNTCYVRAVLAF